MTVPIFFIVGIVTLLLLAALTSPLAARTGLPLQVLLAALGAAFGCLTLVFGIEPAGVVLDTYEIWFVQQLALEPSVLLTSLLPLLLFEMTLAVDVRRLVDDLMPVLVMAIVAVVVATGTVGLAVWGSSEIALMACLVLGAAVATTDPAAVITTFREIGAPRRLLVILEGESLLNDAAAIALFALLVAALEGAAPVTPFGVVASFVYSFVAGMATGLGMAYLAALLYPRLGRSTMAEMTVTLALAYGAYLGSEFLIGGSGVVAVVFAGLVTGSSAFLRMGPGNWTRARLVWEHIGFWANATILPLAASLVPGLVQDLTWREAALIPVVYLFALVARAVILFGLLPVLDLMRLSTPLSLRQKILVLWGGVRGGVTLVLAISIADLSVLGEAARPLGAAAAGYALLTLLINASTLRLATRLLGLSALSAHDILLREQIVAGSLERVRRVVRDYAEARNLEPEAVAAVDEMLEEREREVLDRTDAQGARQIPFGDSLRAGLAIICGREARLIRRAFEEGAIGPRATTALRLAADRIGDATRLSGRAGYEAAVRASIRPSATYKLAVLLSYYLSIDRPLRGQIELQLTRLLETERILRELHEFATVTLASMVGAPAAENIAALLIARSAEVDAEIEALSAQYPEYSRKLDQMLVARAAMRRERQQVRQLAADGIVGPELHDELTRELDHRERLLTRPPELDLRVPPSKLIDRVGIFADLTPVQKRRLGRRLHTRLTVPHEPILVEGQRGREMYFIASGVVHMDHSGGRRVLAGGDFFGEIALVRPHQRRRSRAVSMGYCRLLVLSRRDFKRLAARDPSIERLIREAAQRQLAEGPGDAAGKDPASAELVHKK